MPNNSNTAFGLRRILLTVNILHLGGANRLTRNLRRSRHATSQADAIGNRLITITRVI